MFAGSSKDTCLPVVNGRQSDPGSLVWVIVVDAHFLPPGIGDFDRQGLVELVDFLPAPASDGDDLERLAGERIKWL